MPNIMPPTPMMLFPVNTAAPSFHIYQRCWRHCSRYSKVSSPSSFHYIVQSGSDDGSMRDGELGSPLLPLLRPLQGEFGRFIFASPPIPLILRGLGPLQPRPILIPTLVLEEEDNPQRRTVLPSWNTPWRTEPPSTPRPPPLWTPVRPIWRPYRTGGVSFP